MDILRYDGKEQFGVYRIEKGELRFTLANPGDKRPTGETVKQARGTSHSHYLFHRLPTKEGFATLKHHFQSDTLPDLVAAPTD